jgi:hypothetical protein
VNIVESVQKITGRYVCLSFHVLEQILYVLFNLKVVQCLVFIVKINVFWDKTPSGLAYR